MGFFTNKASPVAAPTIRIEKVAVPPKPKPRLPHLNGGASGSRPRSSPALSAAAASGRSSASPKPSSAGPPPRDGARSSSPRAASSGDDRHRLHAASRKRKALAQGSRARQSPVVAERPGFVGESSSDSDEGDWEDALDPRKRRKWLATSSRGRAVDTDRVLAHPDIVRAASAGADEHDDGGARRQEEPDRDIGIVHAADVASLAEKGKPALGAAEDEVAFRLRYPGSRQEERYELVRGADTIDVIKEIIKVVKYVAETYLTEEEARPFLNPNGSVIRQLERASSANVQDARAFKAALRNYNGRLLTLQEDGAIARNLALKHDLPSHVVELILRQVYDRIVAPKVDLLKRYQNGSDNVYGELLHPFISSILLERVGMTCKQVFVDLGSGVGNVVLQAALEIGCESWGCEMMDNACNLAEGQHREFLARCRLWGVAPGQVHLERGDFRVNSRVQEVLKRADVVLVNNQAFTSQLNDDLVRMFLDLKQGCKIVSLKSFVHDYKSANYNVNDVGSTILDVEELTYPADYVSWTNAPGTFCISTRK